MKLTHLLNLFLYTLGPPFVYLPLLQKNLIAFLDVHTREDPKMKHKDVSNNLSVKTKTKLSRNGSKKHYIPNDSAFVMTTLNGTNNICSIIN